MTIDTNQIFQSKIFKGIVIGIGVLFVLSIGFKVGFIIGVKKADFSCRWSDNYQRNFGGPKAGILVGFKGKEFVDANGTVGQIININSSTLVVKGVNDVEKIILTDDATSIQRFRDTIKIDDLTVGDNIIVIGQPNNDGQIEAKFVRVMPTVNEVNSQNMLPPPDMMLFKR
ncbi:MAG: hypothetical protein COU29_03140 [Candidatus Magasanikbacteria bacterium CG10_big_fil_rev_8_21_14_0_10_36_32]|uniref:Uncharacterized protein n=1 Tax=Candidatus Magasanikbacteria bacterium CG10_big_fil_rev_8_21_14_0_10_36_32 TaxID=1974646 RepID=A0A2M6W633_9BACT|nr:MAG: hypothetical protein COU29_03140 [Candidatus Magasanikbacteria bacterium CG10_big_fil_rev_8_21_14_0_10_36_32]